MAYDQDKVTVPQPSPAPDNKFDGTGNPDRGETASFDPNLTPNLFPHETGSDSLSGDEVIFS